MPRLDVARDARDAARGLHRGDEMVEEALLGALERRARRRFRLRVERAMLGARYSGRLHRRGERQALFGRAGDGLRLPTLLRSEEHTSELQSLMRISYAVFCL